MNHFVVASMDTVESKGEEQSTPDLDSKDDAASDNGEDLFASSSDVPLKQEKTTLADFKGDEVAPKTHQLEGLEEVSLLFSCSIFFLIIAIEPD